VRLFVAVWPSEEVRAALAAHPRPAVPGVRWTTPDQWHVTLRFLGDIDRAAAPALPPATGTRATMGPATVRLGRRLLAVPVAGLDALADAVDWPSERPFRGHVTLARAGRRASIPPSLAGVPLAGAWTVERVTLVRSELHPEGARYEIVEGA
jgi:2'-5' RNA ligase